RAANSDRRGARGHADTVAVGGADDAGDEAQPALQQTEYGAALAHALLVVLVIDDAKARALGERHDLAVLELDHRAALFARADDTAGFDEVADLQRALGAADS